MNNYLMSYGPSLWKEINIDKTKLVSISLFINNIFNYFLTLRFVCSTISFYLKLYFNNFNTFYLYSYFYVNFFF